MMRRTAGAGRSTACISRRCADGMSGIPETSEIIWEKMLEIMDDHIARGHLKAD